MRPERYETTKAIFSNHKRLPMGEEWRVTTDDTPRHGFDPHYFYHTAWGARKLEEIRPFVHVDVSSQLQFVTIVSAFIPTVYYEFRVPNIKLDGLDIVQGDITNLPIPSESVSSLSCMHTIEHIGLGRYGDPVDPDGDLKAAKELTRVLAPGGKLLMVSPVGRPRVVYNAHRIYSYEMMREMFASLQQIEFSLYSERMDKFIQNADPALVAHEESIYGGCGMWVFQK